jgi:hypothetical protein
MTKQFYLGVDLGQSQDPTAVVLVEREQVTLPEIDPESYERIIDYVYHVKGTRRLKLGTPYPEIVRQVTSIASMLPGPRQLTYVVDATGVGRPVVDLLRDAIGSVAPIVPVVFTGGDSVRYEDGFYRVPKKDLVHNVMVLLQSGKLRIAERSEDSRALVNELTNMRIKITPEANSTYEAWRQGQHDDLVFALSLACWRARRTERKPLGSNKPILW